MKESTEKMKEGLRHSLSVITERMRAEQIEEIDLKSREILMKNGERCLFSKNVKGALLERI